MYAKGLDFKDKVNFKIYDVTTWLINETERLVPDLFLFFKKAFI